MVIRNGIHNIVFESPLCGRISVAWESHPLLHCVGGWAEANQSPPRLAEAPTRPGQEVTLQAALMVPHALVPRSWAERPLLGLRSRRRRGAFLPCGVLLVVKTCFCLLVERGRSAGFPAVCERTLETLT